MEDPIPMVDLIPMVDPLPMVDPIPIVDPIPMVDPIPVVDRYPWLTSYPWWNSIPWWNLSVYVPMTDPVRVLPLCNYHNCLVHSLRRRSIEPFPLVQERADCHYFRYTSNEAVASRCHLKDKDGWRHRTSGNTYTTVGPKYCDGSYNQNCRFEVRIKLHGMSDE